MLFHTFPSQRERKKAGGSDFLEFQYCKMKSDTKIQKLVSISGINHWQDDSLYVHLNDLEAFADEYRDIFSGGIYRNYESGPVDVHGINYYKPELLETIMVKIFEGKTTDHEVLIEWLYRARYYNGFYILGI